MDVRVGPLELKPATTGNWMYEVADEEHAWQITHCQYDDGHWVNSAALVELDPAAPAPVAPVLSAEALALRATARLGFDFPELHVSPSGGRQTVGLPMWVWVDKSWWAPREAHDSDAGLSVVLTAAPRTLLFDPGDGSAVVDCGGPGTPFDQHSGRGWDASPTCGHTYVTASSAHRSGVTSTTTTVVWSFSWVASDGRSGTLPDLQVVHHEDFEVRAYTAVTD